MPRLACFAALLVLFAASTGAAAEPVEISVGDLIVVRTTSAERWYIQPHGGTKRNVLVITVSATGGVEMSTIPLPDSQEPQDPDDPDDPPPTDLATLVKQWAAEVDDAQGRLKLSAAYAATVSLIDGGQIENIETLVALQGAANKLVLGSSASKWTGFFRKLADHLEANPPGDLAAHREAWLAISEGLK